MRPLVASYVPQIINAAKRFVDETVLVDVSEVADIPWVPLSEDQREQLLYFAVLAGDVLREIGHQRLERALESDIEPYTEAREALAAFHEARFDFIKYTVDPSTGWHTAAAASGAWFSASDGLTVIGEPSIERDSGYCCERCDGPRPYTPAEAEASGFYAGWYVGTAKRYGNDVFAFGRVPNELVHHVVDPASVSVLGSDHKARFRSFLLPWSVSL